MLIQKRALEAALANYATDYPEERVFLERVSAFVQGVDAPCSRATLEGHITASAWILSPDRQSTLLIHHRVLDRWFQPGGHVEPTDHSLQHASEREAIEETGLTGVRLAVNTIYDIDIHRIPAKGPILEHLHYDVRHLFIADSWDVSAHLSEVKAVKWVPLIDIEGIEKEGSLQRMADKALQLLDLLPSFSQQ